MCVCGVRPAYNGCCKAEGLVAGLGGDMGMALIQPIMTELREAVEESNPEPRAVRAVEVLVPLVYRPALKVLLISFAPCPCIVPRTEPLPLQLLAGRHALVAVAGKPCQTENRTAEQRTVQPVTCHTWK